MGKEFQTTFEWSKPHFSESHQTHKTGPTSPYQQDLGIRMPSGKLKKVGNAEATKAEVDAANTKK